MNALRKNIIYLLVLQGGNYLLPLMTLPYLARVLGVDVFGEFGLTFTITQYLVMFIEFGFNLSASKKIATAKNKQEVVETFYTVLLAKLFLLIVVIAVLILFEGNQIDSATNYIWFAMPQLIGSVLFPVWYFQGVEKLSKVTISTLVGRFLIYPLIFVFVDSSSDIGLAIFIQTSAFLLVSLIGITLALIDLRASFYLPKIKQVLESLKDSFPLYSASLAMSLYTISTPLIINSLSNVYEVGVFNGADKIKAAVLGLFLVLGNALYTRASKRHALSLEEGLKFAKKVAIYQGGVALLVSISIYFLSDLIVELLLGRQYVDSVVILKVLSPLFIIVTTSVVIGNYILLPLGYKKIYATLPIATGSIHILLASLLVYKFGSIGGAISILTIESITLLTYCVILYKKSILKKFILS